MADSRRVFELDEARGEVPTAAGMLAAALTEGAGRSSRSAFALGVHSAVASSEAASGEPPKPAPQKTAQLGGGVRDRARRQRKVRRGEASASAAATSPSAVRALEHKRSRRRNEYAREQQEKHGLLGPPVSPRGPPRLRRKAAAGAAEGGSAGVHRDPRLGFEAPPPAAATAEGGVPAGEVRFWRRLLGVGSAEMLRVYREALTITPQMEARMSASEARQVVREAREHLVLSAEAVMGEYREQFRARQARLDAMSLFSAEANRCRASTMFAERVRGDLENGVLRHRILARFSTVAYSADGSGASGLNGLLAAIRGSMWTAGAADAAGPASLSRSNSRRRLSTRLNADGASRRGSAMSNYPDSGAASMTSLVSGGTAAAVPPSASATSLLSSISGMVLGAVGGGAVTTEAGDAGEASGSGATRPVSPARTSRESEGTPGGARASPPGARPQLPHASHSTHELLQRLAGAPAQASRAQFRPPSAAASEGSVVSAASVPPSAKAGATTTEPKRPHGPPPADHDRAHRRLRERAAGGCALWRPARLEDVLEEEGEEEGKTEGEGNGEEHHQKRAAGRLRGRARAVAALLVGGKSAAAAADPAPASPRSPEADEARFENLVARAEGRLRREAHRRREAMASRIRSRAPAARLYVAEDELTDSSDSGSPSESAATRSGGEDGGKAGPAADGGGGGDDGGKGKGTRRRVPEFSFAKVSHLAASPPAYVSRERRRGSGRGGGGGDGGGGGLDAQPSRPPTAFDGARVDDHTSGAVFPSFEDLMPFSAPEPVLCPSLPCAEFIDTPVMGMVRPVPGNAFARIPAVLGAGSLHVEAALLLNDTFDYSYCAKAAGAAGPGAGTAEGVAGGPSPADLGSGGGSGGDSDDGDEREEGARLVVMDEVEEEGHALEAMERQVEDALHKKAAARRPPSSLYGSDSSSGGSRAASRPASGLAGAASSRAGSTATRATLSPSPTPGSAAGLPHAVGGGSASAASARVSDSPAAAGGEVAADGAPALRLSLKGGAEESGGSSTNGGGGDATNVAGLVTRLRDRRLSYARQERRKSIAFSAGFDPFQRRQSVASRKSAGSMCRAGRGIALLDGLSESDSSETGSDTDGNESPAPRPASGSTSPGRMRVQVRVSRKRESLSAVLPSGSPLSERQQKPTARAWALPEAPVAEEGGGEGDPDAEGGPDAAPSSQQQQPQQEQPHDLALPEAACSGAESSCDLSDDDADAGVAAAAFGGTGGVAAERSDPDEAARLVREYLAVDPTSLALDGRLERVWGALRVPLPQRISFVDKFSHPPHAMRLSKALPVWERAAGLVLQRELALARLEAFEREQAASGGALLLDRTRSSVDGLVDARRRAALSRELAALERDLSRAVARLSSVAGDTLTYEGQPYTDKMARDRVAVLQRVERDRFRRSVRRAARGAGAPETAALAQRVMDPTEALGGREVPVVVSAASLLVSAGCAGPADTPEGAEAFSHPFYRALEVNGVVELRPVGPARTTAAAPAAASPPPPPEPQRRSAPAAATTATALWSDARALGLLAIQAPRFSEPRPLGVPVFLDAFASK